MANDDDMPPAHKVGYRNPPVHSRFKKGQPSANPRGAPRKKECFVTIVREEFAKKETVRTSDGVSQRMSGVRILAKQLKRKAFEGDAAARKEVMKLLANASSTSTESLTREEMLAEAQKQAQLQAEAAKLSMAISGILDFVAQAKKTGLVEFGKDEIPRLAPIGEEIGRYLARRYYRSRQEATAQRAELEALLVKLDQARMATKVPPKPEAK